MIDARTKPVKRGVLAHCGDCGAPLGLAKPPQAKGLRMDVVMAKIAADEGGYAGPEQTRDWTIEPPLSKEQSAALGFARTCESCEKRDNADASHWRELIELGSTDGRTTIHESGMGEASFRSSRLLRPSAR